MVTKLQITMDIDCEDILDKVIPNADTQFIFIGIYGQYDIGENIRHI